MTERRYVVHYRGEVQGVGFRYTVCRISSGFAVRGFVRNLSDGRVEIVAEGAAEEVQSFLKAVREQMAGYIRAEDLNIETATGEFKEFALGW